jgi:polyhydroxyalkanoate synthesis regulator phasin
MLKDLVYAGIGGALMMREKMEEERKKLEELSGVNTSDPKQFLESLKSKGEEEEKRLKEELKATIKEVIEELGLATKKDIEALKS